MLNCSTVSWTGLVPLLIMIRHCSCSRNLVLPSLLFPSTLSPIHYVVPYIFLSLPIFSAYFLFLPSLAQWNFARASPISHFTSSGSFQQAVCKWMTELVVCKLWRLYIQRIVNTDCKKPPFVRGHLGPKVRYESLQPGNVCICYFPVCWRSVY